MADDEMQTARFDDMTWLPPVERPDQLPEGVKDGSMCFVQGEHAVYVYRDSTWLKEASRDDGA